MQVVSTTDARKHFASIVNRVRYTRRPVAVGRRDRADVLIVQFPAQGNDTLTTMTNMNQYGGAFDFLEDEPDCYTADDLKKPYV